MDGIDRAILRELQRDAAQSYLALGAAVGLSAGSTHERVRKLRQTGIISRTTIEVDPEAAGGKVLAFVLISSVAWMGTTEVRAALEAIPELEEAHVVAGTASVLVKVRTPTTKELQRVLRQLFDIDGVTGTQAIVVLESFFERPTYVPANHEST